MAVLLFRPQFVNDNHDDNDDDHDDDDTDDDDDDNTKNNDNHHNLPPPPPPHYYYHYDNSNIMLSLFLPGHLCGVSLHSPWSVQLAVPDAWQIFRSIYCQRKNRTPCCNK